MTSPRNKKLTANQTFLQSIIGNLPKLSDDELSDLADAAIFILTDRDMTRQELDFTCAKDPNNDLIFDEDELADDGYSDRQFDDEEDL